MPDTPLTVSEAMKWWRPGSREWSWRHEAVNLLQAEPEKMLNLLESIRQLGLLPARPGEDPIILGDDRRVWSGHHRLVAANVINPALPLPSDTEIYGDTP